MPQGHSLSRHLCSPPVSPGCMSGIMTKNKGCRLTARIQRTAAAARKKLWHDDGKKHKHQKSHSSRRMNRLNLAPSCAANLYRVLLQLAVGLDELQLAAVTCFALAAKIEEVTLNIPCHEALLFFRDICVACWPFNMGMMICRETACRLLS